MLALDRQGPPRVRPPLRAGARGERCQAMTAWGRDERSARSRLIGSAPRSGGAVQAVWVAGYGLVAVLPLAAVLVGSPPAGRGFVIEFASALGIVALTMLALQLALPGRVPALTRALGADVAIR